MDNNQVKLKHLKSLSNTLDTKFEGPMGLRFGLDGLLGLIPGVGDVLTSFISLYIIAQAVSLGIGASTLIRMAINLGVENIIGIVPVLGNFFDFYWKANIKNMQLIEEHMANPTRETIKSRAIVGLICVVITSLLLGSVYLAFLVLKAFIVWVSSLSN